MNKDEQIGILNSLVNDFLATAGALVDAQEPTVAQLQELRETVLNASAVLSEAPFHDPDPQDETALAEA